MGRPHGLRHESSGLWEGVKQPKGGVKDMNANELLRAEAGGKITMSDDSGKQPQGDGEKAPKYTHPTTEEHVEAKTLDRGPFEKDKKNKGASKLGTDGEKLSSMAQKVGSPRKGY